MPLTEDVGDVALSHASPTRILPVVVAGKHDTFLLFHIDVKMQQTVEETMSQVHRLLESAEYRARAAAPHGHLSNLLIKQSIHKAEIFHADVPNEDPKATTLPQKVTIVAREYSSELTASFRRPYTSTYRACFADDYPDLLDAAQTKSILIQHEISKTAVGIAAAMVVTSWLLLSALIGIVRKNMEAGFTVAGVGIGVMALFVAVIKGIQK